MTTENPGQAGNSEADQSRIFFQKRARKNYHDVSVNI